MNSFVILSFSVFLCLLTDIWKGKIYNAITLTSLIAIIIINVFQHGLNGLLESILIIIVIALIMIIPFSRNWMGGGDVKLFFLVGVTFGFPDALLVFLHIFLWGGGFSVILFLFQSAFQYLNAKTYSKVAAFHLMANRQLPYSIAIFSGILHRLFHIILI